MEQRIPRLTLAPMAGISDWPFRLLCGEQGADETVTEMISAQGYLTAPKDSRAYRYIMETHSAEKPVAAQLFGHDPAYIAEAARQITDSGLYCGIDINMGCPQGDGWRLRLGTDENAAAGGVYRPRGAIGNAAAAVGQNAYRLG